MKQFPHLLFVLFVMSFFSASAFAEDAVMAEVHKLQHDWAKIQYKTPKNAKEDQFEELSKRAHAVSVRFPDRAEPLIWEGIILSTFAGAKGGLGALGLAKSARKKLEAAEKIDPSALSGSIYTSLGSLYYKVPGWPLSFGDDDRAEEYLLKARGLNPDGIDPNYFYGDFLYEEGRYLEAKAALLQALDAPPRVDRPLADEGRKTEIQAKLKLVEKKLR